VTTLGRGGSDTTAVAIAAALHAELCVIYTDVDGVYTTDPNLVPSARRIDRISFDEMLEMASLGAKVLQTRSVEFGKKYSIPILVKSTFRDGPGTLVTVEDEAMEQVLVSGIPFDTNQAKVTITGIPDRPGIAAKIFGSIAERGVVVDMIIQNVGESGLTDLSFTVPRTDARVALRVTQELAKEIGAREAILDDRIVKVSIVGVGMRSHGGVAAKMFSTLAREGINIMMISTSEIKISCVIEERHTEKAVSALHEAFELNRTETH
jgi:aspartate kinase